MCVGHVYLYKSFSVSVAIKYVALYEPGMGTLIEVTDTLHTISIFVYKYITMYAVLKLVSSFSGKVK